MNGEVFLSHFRNVLPKLNDNAVVVLDNAPYHSTKVEKLPTKSWNKDQLVNWLVAKGISVDKSLLKKELIQLALTERPKHEKYVVDEEAKLQNKTVLRLSPYNCELNTIELIWAQVKGYVAANNNTFKLQEVRRLLDEGLSRVTKENWERCVAHVKKEEEKLWKLDDVIEAMEEDTNQFLINVGSDSSESESDQSMLAEELSFTD